MNIKKNVLVVTGSRADYSLLYPLLVDMNNEYDFDVGLVVTGMHLSKSYGRTVDQIRGDGFRIIRELDLGLESDSAVGICKSMSVGLIGFAGLYEMAQFDFLILLGDRFELWPAATAALVAKIPVVHIHGGEVTVGAFDDAIRHSITKMSSLHFTSTEQYRKRVIQLGEHPSRVFNVGALGIDNIARLNKLSDDKLESILGITLNGRTILVTFHPETLSGHEESGFAELLEVLRAKTQFNVVFTGVNADTRGHKIEALTKEYVRRHHGRAVLHTSLGHEVYMSLLAKSVAVVGNSSSGLIEAPSLRVATINIGDRQKGRVRANSVLDCGNDTKSIARAFDQLDEPSFQKKVKNTINPHGDSGVSLRILEHLRRSSSKLDVKKQFYDLTK